MGDPRLERGAAVEIHLVHATREQDGSQNRLVGSTRECFGPPAARNPLRCRPRPRGPPNPRRQREAGAPPAARPARHPLVLKLPAARNRLARRPPRPGPPIPRDACREPGREARASSVDEPAARLAHRQLRARLWPAHRQPPGRPRGRRAVSRVAGREPAHRRCLLRPPARTASPARRARRRRNGRVLRVAFRACSSGGCGLPAATAHDRSRTPIPKTGCPAQPRASCSSSVNTLGSTLSSIRFDPAEFVPAVLGRYIPDRRLLQTGDGFMAPGTRGSPRSACRRCRRPPSARRASGSRRAARGTG